MRRVSDIEDKPTTMRKLLIILPLLLALAAPVLADIELGGLITSRVLTPTGKEFVNLFCSQWEGVPGFSEYAIDIREKADARWGSVISIYVNETMVYQKVIGTRLAKIEQFVKPGIDAAYDYVFKLACQEKTFTDGDMAHDGL